MIAAVTLFTSAIFAQDAITTQTNKTEVEKHNDLPQVKAKNKVAEINAFAQLQGDQISKVNNLYIDYYTKKDALNNDRELTKEALKTKTDALKKERNAQLKTILTPAQLKSYEDNMAKLKD